jgi:hypothetical protein
LPESHLSSFLYPFHDQLLLLYLVPHISFPKNLYHQILEAF